MFVDLQQAATILRSNNLVAIPTETVYGLAGNGMSDIACKKIYIVKNRPQINPLIMHISSLKMLEEICYINKTAITLAEKFWPGPLTLVLKSKNKTSKLASNNLDTIAVRMPEHKIAKELLDMLDFPIAAPSANLSGSISPTDSKHVIKNFPNIPIIEGAKSVFGIESTILDISEEDNIQILRHGFITKEIISDVLKKSINISSTTQKIKAPGMLKKHYAPNCDIKINQERSPENSVSINFGDSNLSSRYILNLSPDADLAESASNFYELLHRAEEIVIKYNLEGIFVAKIPEISMGIAINDKLKRAAEK
jgi:L-threonylcarbamoyladenylate synthase